jgi:hypothetical protein
MSMDLMYRRHRGSSAEVRRDKNGSRGLMAKPTRMTVRPEGANYQ